MSCCPGPKTGKEFDPACEGPSEADLDRFGGDTDACPNCGEEVWHDAAICPSCRSAIQDRADSARKPWVMALGIAALVAFVLVFVL